MPAEKSTNMRHRRWCFTLNNPSGSTELYDDWECERVVAGLEIAPETKTPHHQGYVRFAHPKGLAGVRKLFQRAHWEPAKGNEEQCIAYCAKDGVIIIDWPEHADDDAPSNRQGKRNDIIHVRELVQAGCGMAEICEQVDSYQAIRVAETMLKYAEAVRTWRPHVVWVYGPTGVGKSKYAHEISAHICDADGTVSETTPWVSGETGRWFEGYDAHQCVIFDDFRGDFCKFHVLLRLLDRYPYRVEVKGASRQFLAKKIVITSCLPPHRAYARSPEDLLQLGRRIDEVIEIRANGMAYSMPGHSLGQPPSVLHVPATLCAHEALELPVPSSLCSTASLSAHEVEGNTKASPPPFHDSGASAAVAGRGPSASTRADNCATLPSTSTFGDLLAEYLE